MLTVHHLSISQSERIIWLCEELGVQYDLVRYDREESGSAPPAYKALHPLGTAPTVTDGALTLAETGAIMEYISRRYGHDRLILSSEQPDFAEYLFWFHYGNGSLVPAFMMETVAARLGKKGLSARTDIGFALVEKRLGEAAWFAGENFTMADIMMHFPLTRARAVSGRGISRMPNLQRYLNRVAERPAYRAAMARAEPDASINAT